MVVCAVIPFKEGWEGGVVVGKCGFLFLGRMRGEDYDCNPGACGGRGGVAGVGRVRRAGVVGVGVLQAVGRCRVRGAAVADVDVYSEAGGL